MKIQTLFIQNFGPIESVTLKLDGRGLTNVEGVNKDDPSANSNGSGKSTIPDALYWCLFNETARGISGDDVISNFTGKDCLVGVLMEDGDSRYEVKRWRKCKGGSKPNGCSLIHIAPDGTRTDLTLGTDKLTQVEIERVLGCSKEVFTKAVYSGQEALPDLPNMTDKQIKLLVEESAGIEVLARAYDLAKKHRLNTERGVTDANRTVQEADRRLTDAQNSAADVTVQHAEWGGKHKVKVKAANDLCVVLDGQVKAKVAERDKIDRAANEARLAALQASVSAVSGENTELRRLFGAVSNARAAVSAAKAAYDAKAAEAKRARTHFDSFDSKVGVPCGECGKAYAAEDIAGAKEIARTKLNALVAEARELVAPHTAATAALEAAQLAHDTYLAGMTDVSASMAEIKTVQGILNDFERLNNDVIRLHADHLRAFDEMTSLAAETNPFVKMLDDCKKVVVARGHDAAAFRVVLEGAQKAHEIANAAVAAFGPTGVRAYVLDTVTPYLNSRTANYLGTLSDGRISAIWTTLATNSKGELVEKFCIEVAKDGTGGKSFKALSGGEKRKVRLACALALQDLVASRATKPIDLWIGDEIDDALDPAGLERLMSVLEEKAREKGTVLIISHNSLSDFIRETTTVTMEGGKSTVTGSLV